MNAPAFLILSGLVGACLGSASATVAIRAARGEPFVHGRSHCDGCGIVLSYAQTVPLLAHLHHNGSCRACGAKIDPSHLLGEILGAALGVSAIAVAPGWTGALLFLLGQLMLAASLIDARMLRLPDPLTAGCAVIAIGLSAAGGRDHLLAGLGSAFIVVILLGVLAAAHRRARGVEGLGLGDVKLAGALALWLGGSIFIVIAFASAAALLARRILHRGSVQIPFGPYIAAAAWIVGLTQMVWGLDR